MQQEIIEFICDNRIATVCYVNNGLPYCFNCLYAAIPQLKSLVFKSSKSSLHSLSLRDGTKVAGTIYHAPKGGFNNTGVQLLGQIAGDDETCKIAETAYYKRFPAAKLIPGQLFVLTLDEIKFSHTACGIRKKMSWQKST